MHLNSDSLTDRGRMRSRNEDALLIDPQQRFFILADGMGGHPAGDVASRMAVKTLAERLAQGLPAPQQELPEVISAGFLAGNRRLQNAGRENPPWLRMGTTLVLLLIEDRCAFFANVGDSRAYLMRAGELRQCSLDHNLGGQGSGLSNILTQAVGLNETLDIFQQQLPLLAGDRLLLCSDGLTNMLNDAAIRQLIAPPTTLPDACRKLIEAANAAGGHDNISVILVETTT